MTRSAVGCFLLAWATVRPAAPAPPSLDWARFAPPLHDGRSAPPLQPAPKPAGTVFRQAPPVVVVRDWLPVGAIAMALPLPARAQRSPEDQVVAQVADLALLRTLQEAMGGLAARVGKRRTRTARHFVATAAPEDLPEVLRVMRQVAAKPLPARHVEFASARFVRERGFRRGSPQDRFDQLFSAGLAGVQVGGEVDAPAAPARPAGSLAASGNSLADPSSAAFVAKATAPPAVVWGPPAWVVVADTARARLLARDPSSATPAEPFVLPSLPRPPGDPVALPDAADPSRVRVATVRETAEVVATWVGVAYRLAPGTTLTQADFLRALLVAQLERQRDDALYALSAEVDLAGRLLVEYSATPEAARAWESRIDEALFAVGSEDGKSPSGTESRLARLFRAVRGDRNRRMANPAHVAQVAADALLRGATRPKVLSIVREARDVRAEQVARAARGARQEIRVEYGAVAR